MASLCSALCGYCGRCTAAWEADMSDDIGASNARQNDYWKRVGGHPDAGYMDTDEDARCECCGEPAGGGRCLCPACQQNADNIGMCGNDPTRCCPHCGGPVKHEYSYCPFCGKRLVEGANETCLVCGVSVNGGANYCSAHCAALAAGDSPEDETND